METRQQFGTFAIELRNICCLHSLFFGLIQRLKLYVFAWNLNMGFLEEIESIETEHCATRASSADFSRLADQRIAIGLL